MAACMVGWAHSLFGRFDHEDLESLIVGVARQALADSKVDAEEVDGIWLGNLNGGFVPDSFCSSLVLQADAGLRWAPATRVKTPAPPAPPQCIPPSTLSTPDNARLRWSSAPKK